MNNAERPSDAEAIYTKAAKAELSKQYDLAFRLYVKSAELFLHLSRSSKGRDKDESKWKGSAGKALQRAEKIKAFVNQAKGGSETTTSSHQGQGINGLAGQVLGLTPIGVDHFSTREQFYVLKKGASINGLSFLLWDEPLVLPHGVSHSSPYQDQDGQPKISPEQAKVSPIWRRPRVRDEVPADAHPNPPRPRILPQEILQHIVTDCSVCASISVCLEHARRFGSNLAESAVHSLQEQLGVDSPNSQAAGFFGGYKIKIFFNGAWRRIGQLVDDKLPHHPINGTLMCMSVYSTANGGCLQRNKIWPSILEKGYMKLMGGYDFPGSNSSIDLHAIAGWIPEHLEIKGPNFEREKTWERILDGFQSGCCMLTLGTGTNFDIGWLDVTEDDGIRNLAILDTWVNPEHKNQYREPSRTLQMPWTDVLNVFDGIYLSWDPSKWPIVLNFHGMWNRIGQEEQSSTRQVSLLFENGNEVANEEIWILLTRHVVDSRRTSDFISLKVELDDDPGRSSSVINQSTVSMKGNYTNSTHILVRTRVPSSQKAGVLTIFASYDGEATEIGFTLTAYAGRNFNIAWDENIPVPPFTGKINGILTNKNAGGNCTYPTFMLNPQYHLRVYPQKSSESTFTKSTKSKVTLTLQTSRDVPVNIAIVWSQGNRIDELVEKDLTASSGAYAYGLARVTKELSAGDYTIILSAFEPQHMGPFSLGIESSTSFVITAIPQEGAGMYTKVVRGAWNSQTAGGGPTSDRYSTNPIFEIDVPKLTQLKIRLQLLRPFTATSLNITIFPVSSDGSLRQHIATSGAYNDAISGVATPQITLSVGKYWVVPSTYNPGVHAGFQLILYTTVAGMQIIDKGESSW